ncbi:hypothetical protein OROHE_011621 [Orobanche hederae]
MIEKLFEKLCSFISSGAEKLVHYVHKLAKTTTAAQYVSEDLSRLRNLWILLKASISSAMNNIKEKTLQGFRFMMKWVLQLFKWFTAQLLALIGMFQDVRSKTVSGVSKYCPMHIAKILEKMIIKKMKGSIGGNKKDLLLLLISLLVKYMNTNGMDVNGIVDQGLLGEGFNHFMNIIEAIIWLFSDKDAKNK